MAPRSPSYIDRHVAELAALYGWRHHHEAHSLTLDGYTDGFPPHALLRDGRLLFVAVAAPTGAMTPPEEAWAAELEAVTTVALHIVQRGELRTLTGVLRPNELSPARPPSVEPRAPPAKRRAEKDAHPSPRGGRRKSTQTTTS